MLLPLLVACGEPAAPPPPATPPPAASASAPTPAPPAKFGLGRPATAEEVAAWDIDVDADWNGLPQGRGTVADGKALYTAQCLACHGPALEGGVGPKLKATEPVEGFGNDYKIPKTVGNYWPYASTVFDYVRRAMPQTAPGSLSDDQVYSLVAYLLAENNIVPQDFVADSTSIKGVKMPVKAKFVPDDREQVNTFR